MFGGWTFNSCLPVSTLMWMAVTGMKPQLVFATRCEEAPDKFSLICEEHDVSTVIRTDKAPADLYFAFEKGFDKFDRLMVGASGKKKNTVDVLICEAKTYIKRKGEVVGMGEQLCPMEVKQTVVPDASTCNDDPSGWAPELVLRPATTSYCAMSMFTNMDEATKAAIKEKMLDLKLNDVLAWNNPAEVREFAVRILEATKFILDACTESQVSMMLHHVWATRGKKHDLSDDAFDMLAWTDAAIMAILCNEADKALRNEDKDIGRHMRSVVRFCLTMRDLCQRGTFHYDEVYTNIAFGKQTDKEISIRGSVLREYVKSDLFANPRIKAEQIHEIVFGDGLELLTPPRALDQILYHTQRKGSGKQMVDRLRAELDSAYAEIDRLRQIVGASAAPNGRKTVLPDAAMNIEASPGEFQECLFP